MAQDTRCHFCSENSVEESALHLFLKYPYLSQIWFWMGNFQHYYLEWQPLEDIEQFVLTFPLKQRKPMLMVISVICWSIWRTRNSICFENKNISTIRNMILLTCSLLNYWVGNKRPKELQHTHLWTPDDMDMVPLQTMSPLRMPMPEMEGGTSLPLVSMVLAN